MPSALRRCFRYLNVLPILKQERAGIGVCLEVKPINNEKLNSSGCLDKTAFDAIQNVRRAERKKLIEEIKELAARYGYEIDCRIDLKEIKEVHTDL